jgi:hypothetical protein
MCFFPHPTLVSVDARWSPWCSCGKSSLFGLSSGKQNRSLSSKSDSLENRNLSSFDSQLKAFLGFCQTFNNVSYLAM